MNSNRLFKVNIIKEIIDKLNNSKALVIADYQNINVKQFQELRNRLRKKNVEIKVYKNRLFKLAAKKFGVEELKIFLIGSNVFAFGIDDDISPAKIIAKFSKEFKVLKIKGGIYEKKVIDANKINEIATLPTFEEAIIKLATQLISPIKYVGIGLVELTKSNHLFINKNKIEKNKKGE